VIKLMGSLLVFAAGGLVWWIQQQERRRKGAVLADLASVLRQMQEEIRMMRTPMPELFRKLEKRCGQDVSDVLCAMSGAVEQGTEVAAVWKRSVCALPVDERTRDVLCKLDFCGDEEKLCKELSFTAYEIAKCAEVLESSRREDGKRISALCFSWAALLVILLI
jgi:stage III sporulation protein AB